MTIYEGNDVTLSIGDSENPKLAVFLTLEGTRLNTLRIDAPVFSLRTANGSKWAETPQTGGQRQLIIEGEGMCFSRVQAKHCCKVMLFQGKPLPCAAPLVMEISSHAPSASPVLNGYTHTVKQNAIALSLSEQERWCIVNTTCL